MVYIAIIEPKRLTQVTLKRDNKNVDKFQSLYFQHAWETSSNFNNSLRQKLNNHSGSYKYIRYIKISLSKAGV